VSSALRSSTSSVVCHFFDTSSSLSRNESLPTRTLPSPPPNTTVAPPRPRSIGSVRKSWRARRPRTEVVARRPRLARVSAREFFFPALTVALTEGFRFRVPCGNLDRCDSRTDHALRWRSDKRNVVGTACRRTEGRKWPRGLARLTGLEKSPRDHSIKGRHIYSLITRPPRYNGAHRATYST
jgi:hypothetical protein